MLDSAYGTKHVRGEYAPLLLTELRLRCTSSRNSEETSTKLTSVLEPNLFMPEWSVGNDMDLYPSIEAE